MHVHVLLALRVVLLLQLTQLVSEVLLLSLVLRFQILDLLPQDILVLAATQVAYRVGIKAVSEGPPEVLVGCLPVHRGLGETWRAQGVGAHGIPLPVEARLGVAHALHLRLLVLQQDALFLRLLLDLLQLYFGLPQLVHQLLLIRLHRLQVVIHIARNRPVQGHGFVVWIRIREIGQTVIGVDQAVPGREVAIHFDVGAGSHAIARRVIVLAVRVANVGVPGGDRLPAVVDEDRVLLLLQHLLLLLAADLALLLEATIAHIILSKYLIRF